MTEAMWTHVRDGIVANRQDGRMHDSAGEPASTWLTRLDPNAEGALQ